jgi:hemolysin activation/secretion protein
LYGSYDFPLLGPRLRLNLYGGHSEFDIHSETTAFDFLGRGTFYGGILRYNLLQFDDWFLDLKGTLEHVRSKVNTDFIAQTVQQSNVEFFLAGPGIQLHRSDDLSNSFISFDVLKSLGGESNNQEFQLARLNSDSLFTIYNVSAAHGQYLDEDKVGRFAGSFRWIEPDERLVPAKMTSFGGMYTIRGYDEYEVIGDGGIIASVQYEYDLVAEAKAKESSQAETQQISEKKPFLRKLAPLVFFDYGRSNIEDPIGTEKRHEELMSVGAGTILELGEHFRGVVYYGYPLAATDDTREGKGRLNVGLLIRW